MQFKFNIFKTSLSLFKLIIFSLQANENLWLNLEIHAFTGESNRRMKVACKGCTYPWISWSTCWCWGSQFLISVSRLLCKSVAAHVSHLFTHWLLAQHNRKWCSDAMLKCYNMLVSSCVGRKYILITNISLQIWKHCTMLHCLAEYWG